MWRRQQVKLVRSILLIAGILFVGILFITDAEAGCRWVWQGINSRYECDGGGSPPNEFTVINKSGTTVYALVGFHKSADSGGGDGRGNSGISVYTPAAWVAKGWYKVSPGKRRTIFSGPHTKIYVRIEKNGTPVKPRGSDKTALFCIHPTKKFYSREADEKYGSPYELNGKQGSSCQSVRGKMVRFYQMRTHTDFTINN
jgi:hypothetical protein